MLNGYGIKQSMNSAGGRCHDNARCESMWVRMKNELFYIRGRRSTDYTTEQLKTMIWRSAPRLHIQSEPPVGLPTKSESHPARV